MNGTTYEDALTDASITLCGDSCMCAPSPDQTPHRSTTLFFPGCSFMNNAQSIMRDVFNDLRAADPSCGITLLCCGKILEFETGGKAIRDDFEMQLVERCISKRVRKIIAACPNCVHELRAAFARYHSEYEIEIVALPYALAASGKRIQAQAAMQFMNAESPDCKQASKPVRFAVHDSCPDRALGEFAQATRSLFAPDMLVETAHNRKKSLCCGSLANSAGNYDAGDRLAHLHGEEGVQAGAAALVTSCMSCAHQLSVLQDALPVFHYLELLYETRIPWRAMPATTQTRFLFESLEGTRTFIGADA